MGILAAGCFLSGCDNEIKKDAPEKYIYVNKSSLNVFFGDKVQLKANPAGEIFEWSSVDPAIATVTSDGLVEAVGLGSTEIIVSQGTSRTEIPVNVTVPTVDKAVVAGGNGQFQIAVQTLSDRIAIARIIWNNSNDSTDIAVDNRIGVFMQNVNYSGENGYVFRIVSFDKFGNRSLASETTATLLRNRDVTSAGAMDDGALTVNWGTNIQYVAHCMLSYVNHNGLTISKKVLPSEATTPITDYSSDLSYTTLFLIPPITDTFRVETVAPAVVESTPFKGPHILSAAAPCEIPARDFDYGGEGLAFHDTYRNNPPSNSYRTNAGDQLSKTVDVGTLGQLEYTIAGEWLVYTIEVQDAGVYAVDVNLSVKYDNGGALYFSIDGNRSETVTVPSNNQWNVYLWAFATYPQLIQPKFPLSAGKHKVRFTFGTGAQFNLMGLKFTYTGE
jgi:hypothetical protein